MPPHRDTRDGPVVRAATKALDTEDINYILIGIPLGFEKELEGIFGKTPRAKMAGKDSQEVADDRLFGNAIRLHCAGEGAPSPGMKPAGISECPVVPKAGKAIPTGNRKETIGFILKTVEDDRIRRFQRVIEKKQYDVGNGTAGREFIGAFIGWGVNSHHLYRSETVAPAMANSAGRKPGAGTADAGTGDVWQW